MMKPATDKQIKAIKNMCEWLEVDKPFMSGLTVAEASAIIEDYINQIKEREQELWDAYTDYPDPLWDD